MTDAIVEVRNVVKRYHGKTILDGISLRFRAGTITALVGPSGGGKSTLLRSINGLNAIDDGEIAVGPHKLDKVDRGNDEVERAVRRFAGMIFQDFQLFPHLTALGNVAEGRIAEEGPPSQVIEDRKSVV